MLEVWFWIGSGRTFLTAISLSDAKRLLYGVPQSSVMGLILFSLYTTPLINVIQNHPGICFHFYADDTQLYIHLTHKHATLAFERLKTAWMMLESGSQ